MGTLYALGRGFVVFVLGLLYLFGSGGILPDLDRYFRWIGGPAT